MRIKFAQYGISHAHASGKAAVLKASPDVEFCGVYEPDAEVRLTRREQQVLKLLAGGVSTLAIAERLHISRSTVRNHVHNILSKLGTHSRLEAVALGVRHQLF